MVSESTARLAVLIDADNARPSITEGLLGEVTKCGTAHVKRAYGDWTGTSLKGWQDPAARPVDPATALSELDRRSSGDGKPGILYARDKRRRPGE